MDFVIEETDFETTYKIWSELLWPGRESKIEPLSAISDDLTIDTSIFRFKAKYLLCRYEGNIIGVLSGHPTSETSYRLRGLYVAEKFRQKGLGTQLLLKQIEYAKEINMKTVWLLGRVYREPLYTSLGFEVVCKTEKFEFGPHYLMKKFI